MKNLLIIGLLTIKLFAQNKNNDIYIEDIKNLALQRCLNINYEKIGAYKVLNLKDYSFWTYSYAKDEQYTFESITLLDTFVDNQTGNFYKDTISLKAEDDTPPFNTIFAHCMKFYKSSNLNNFIKRMKH